MDLSYFKVKEAKLKWLLWMSGAAGFLSTRTIVGLIKPQPMVDDLSPFLTVIWVISMLVFSWSLATDRWNTFLDRIEIDFEISLRNYEIPESPSPKFLDEFNSTAKTSRNTAATLFAIGFTMTVWGWKDPSAISCSSDLNDIVTCSNNLSMSVIVLLCSVPFFLYWVFILNRISSYFRFVEPTINKEIDEIDYL